MYFIKIFKKNNIFFKNIFKINKKMKVFTSYLILVLFFLKISTFNNRNSIFVSFFSYISIKINKRGNNSIYFNGYYINNAISAFQTPDEIYINDVRQDETKSQKDLQVENK